MSNDDDRVTQALIDAQREAIAISIAGYEGELSEAATLFNGSEHKDALVWALARLPSQMALASGLDGNYAEQARILLQQLPHNVDDVDDLIDNYQSDDSEEDDR